MAIDYDAMPARQRADFASLRERKPNKYRARRTEYNGVMYDSALEAETARCLDIDLERGCVAWWLRQIRIPLGLDFSTRIDFLVAKHHLFWENGPLAKVYAVEVKGVETREFKKVRQLWPKYGPFPLHIIKGGNVEVIPGKS